MVVYKVKDDFYCGAMCKISELRQKGLLCDVTLTVEQDHLPAHRCVLAVASPYFNSLFLGQFKDASMHTIDLSEVTDDVKDLELVVDFMYTGEVNIDESNLDVLVKLSSIFLVDSLKGFCTEYMMQHTSLTTCVRYYLLASVYSLTSVEKVARTMAEPRFHDYIMYDENLELVPGEVLNLLENGLFVHFSALQLLNFVTVWLKDEITEEHILVANRLLDTVDIESVVPVTYSWVAGREKMAKLTEVLEGQTGAGTRLLLEKAEKIYARNFLGAKTDGLQFGSSFAKTNTLTNVEEVVVTLSPAQRLVDACDQNLEHEILKQPVLDMCCYVPRTKTWYHVRHLKPCETGLFSDSRDKKEHLCELVNDFVDTVMFKEELVMMCECQKAGSMQQIHFYNIRNKSWRIVEFKEPGNVLLKGNEELYEYCCCHYLVTDDRSLYMVYKMNIREGENGHAGEYFRCVRLEEDGRTWTTVFKTDIKRSQVYYTGGTLRAKISSVSNELIFTCGPLFMTGYSYIFVVNLNEEHPVPVNIFKELSLEGDEDDYYEDDSDAGDEDDSDAGDRIDGDILSSVIITQTPSHFYIVQDGMDVQKIYEDIRIVYEYEFNSHSVTNPERENIKINHLDTCLNRSWEDMGEMTAASDKAIWWFEGDKTFASRLAEYETKQDGSVTCTVHTPPPFHCMTAMFVGKLAADLLEDMTPIDRYLIGAGNQLLQPNDLDL